MIAAGSAKLIADYWTDVSVAAEAAAMTAKRTDMHRLQELVRLHRLETGAREAARLLGLSPNTERRYREALAAAGLLQGPPEAIPALEELKAAVLKHAPPAVPRQQQSSLECYWERIGALHVSPLRAAGWRREQRKAEWRSDVRAHSRSSASGLRHGGVGWSTGDAAEQHARAPSEQASARRGDAEASPTRVCG